MKSIYSIQTLQRIIDHWGIGQIEDADCFQKVGSDIWRHFIATGHGNFELFSYPFSYRDHAKPKLDEFFESSHLKNADMNLKKEIVHSFDRFHVLLQLTKKHNISSKQAFKDLDLLIGLSIKDAFRVYGTILQIILSADDVNKTNVLSSYAWWSIQENKEQRANVIVDSRLHNHDQLDNAIEIFKNNQPVIEKYILDRGWFELYLSNQMSLHFTQSEKSPAVEVHLSSRKNNLLIYGENLIYYSRDL